MVNGDISMVRYSRSNGKNGSSTTAAVKMVLILILIVLFGTEKQK